MPAGNGLPSIEHIVVLMLENRSFPAGQAPAPQATVTAHLSEADLASYIAAHSSVGPS
jgi:hypothetical protein